LAGSFSGRKSSLVFTIGTGYVDFYNIRYPNPTRALVTYKGSGDLQVAWIMVANQIVLDLNCKHIAGHCLSKCISKLLLCIGYLSRDRGE
jgi:hypothetical protein